LEEVRVTLNKNWNYILDLQSIYKLLYSLHVIEYLMEEKEEQESSKME